MPTRHKRPSIIKQLSISALLLAFLAYMGFSAISGKYGTNNKKKLLADIVQLEAESAEMDKEIADYKKRIALFDPAQLDPDILSERARELLSMAHKKDRIIIIDDID